MRILILEDDNERIKQFKRNTIGHVCDIFNDAASFIDHLEDCEPYDLVCLDHDLGGQVYVDSKEFNTGATVAKHLKNYNWHKDALVLTHSFNKHGAENILNILELPDEHWWPGLWSENEISDLLETMENEDE